MIHFTTSNTLIPEKHAKLLEVRVGFPCGLLTDYEAVNLLYQALVSHDTANISPFQIWIDGAFMYPLIQWIGFMVTDNLGNCILNIIICMGMWRSSEFRFTAAICHESILGLTNHIVYCMDPDFGTFTYPPLEVIFFMTITDCAIIGIPGTQNFAVAIGKCIIIKRITSTGR